MNVVLILLSVLLSIWAIIDLIKCEDEMKYIWIAIIIIMPSIGALLYFTQKNRKKKSSLSNKGIHNR